MKMEYRRGGLRAGVRRGLAVLLLGVGATLVVNGDDTVDSGYGGYDGHGAYSAYDGAEAPSQPDYQNYWTRLMGGYQGAEGGEGYQGYQGPEFYPASRNDGGSSGDDDSDAEPAAYGPAAPFRSAPESPTAPFRSTLEALLTHPDLGTADARGGGGSGTDWEAFLEKLRRSSGKLDIGDDTHPNLTLYRPRVYKLKKRPNWGGMGGQCFYGMPCYYHHYRPCVGSHCVPCGGSHCAPSGKVVVLPMRVKQQGGDVDVGISSTGGPKPPVVWPDFPGPRSQPVPTTVAIGMRRSKEEFLMAFHRGTVFNGRRALWRLIGQIAYLKYVFPVSFFSETKSGTSVWIVSLENRCNGLEDPEFQATLMGYFLSLVYFREVSSDSVPRKRVVLFIQQNEKRVSKKCKKLFNNFLGAFLSSPVVDSTADWSAEHLAVVAERWANMKLGREKDDKDKDEDKDKYDDDDHVEDGWGPRLDSESTAASRRWRNSTESTTSPNAMSYPSFPSSFPSFPSGNSSYPTTDSSHVTYPWPPPCPAPCPPPPQPCPPCPPMPPLPKRRSPVSHIFFASKLKKKKKDYYRPPALKSKIFKRTAVKYSARKDFKDQRRNAIDAVQGKDDDCDWSEARKALPTYYGGTSKVSPPESSYEIKFWKIICKWASWILGKETNIAPTDISDRIGVLPSSDAAAVAAAA